MTNIKIIKNILAVMVCFLLVFVSFPTVDAEAANNDETKWLSFSELVLEKGFVNGIQQPWFVNTSIGNCWGKAYMDGYRTTNYDEEMFKEVFYDSKAMGFDIIKLWLNYNHAGMVFDNEMNVIGIDQTYKENLPKVLKIAQDAGLYVCIATMNHCEGSLTTDASSFKYEQVTKYIHDDEARELLFENWLRPIIEITKDFDNVVLVDLYVEPEADGGVWNVPNGTNWNEMLGFIKSEREFIEKINPELEFFCSATTSAELIYEQYNGIGLDFYGHDYYTKSGTAHDTSSLYMDAPFIYGEVGIHEDIAISDENIETYMQNWAMNYLDAAVTNGVKAGFVWSYGYGRGGHKHSMTDKKFRPRSSSVTYRFWQLDRDYNLAGIDPDMDAPAMAYCTDYSVVFLGSRGAEKYRVERSVDLKNWTEVVTFNPEIDKEYEYESFCFEIDDKGAKVGNTYYYRAIAIDSNGKEITSEPSNPFKVLAFTCDEKDNLVKNGSFEDENGFSNTGEDSKWHLIFQGNKDKEIEKLVKGKYITDGEEGVDAHSGTHSIYKLQRVRQKVQLKPNTDYTFTFYYRFTNTQGYWKHFVGLTVGNPSLDNFNVFQQEWCKLIDPIKLENSTKDGDWHRTTVFFNSGDVTECWVDFEGYRTPDDNGEMYLDDIYLFETVK